MKVVIALDSFKGTMTAEEACGLVAEGIREVEPNCTTCPLSMADGGEGTADALCVAWGGRWCEASVMSPLPGKSIVASYVEFHEQRRVLVEMARASGLPLLTAHERNPMRTTTYGTGELLALARANSPAEILLTVGGSATVDGGVGAAKALGWSFLDGAGNDVGLGGQALAKIVSIRPPGHWDFPAVRVLSDVDSPLCGDLGAARVYGPQKGATPEMVIELERGLENLADVIENDLGINVHAMPGGGAAGGLAAGAVAFFNGQLVSGVDTIMEAIGLKQAMVDADWVITGEGRFDVQSLRGKVVSGVMNVAKQTSTRMAVLAGCVEMDDSAWPSPIECVMSAEPKGMDRDEAIRRGKELLRERAAEFARRVLFSTDVS